jgi:hypothetical protein
MPCPLYSLPHLTHLSSTSLSLLPPYLTALFYLSVSHELHEFVSTKLLRRAPPRPSSSLAKLLSDDLLSDDILIVLISDNLRSNELLPELLFDDLLI